MNNSFQQLADEVAFLLQFDPDIAESSASCAAAAAAVGGNCNAGLHALTVFILACFVGYYVVWKVTPALHAPLMSVTNAISSVIIVGAIFAATQHFYCGSKILGFIAIMLASINIFGGFTITHRMLGMFQKK